MSRLNERASAPLEAETLGAAIGKAVSGSEASAYSRRLGRPSPSGSAVAAEIPGAASANSALRHAV